MFETGNILYFEPFIFKNGFEPKNKYFLILKKENDKVVLASLPTSKDAVPNNVTKELGCIDDPKISFNCFYFPSGVDIATNFSINKRFSFPRCTYVYGYRIDEFCLELFEKQLESNQTNITLKGTLDKDIHRDLISCLKNSSCVKNKYKKII